MNLDTDDAISDESYAEIWKQNAHGALALYQAERSKNKRLLQAIWQLTQKLGGEVRLPKLEAPEGWRLLTYRDNSTLEEVIESRLSKTSPSVAHPAG